MTVRWKSLLAALAVIIAGGAVRLPLEQRYTASLRQQNLLETPLKLQMRDQLGQSFFIAVLGGFRSVVASVMELKTITPWQHSNWGVVDELYSICTTLQPREEHYWEERAWHLACNARDTYLLDSTLTEANRNGKAQLYVEKGLNVLREALQHRPDSWKLWDRLAYYSSMRWNSQPDYTTAIDGYYKAAELSGRSLYVRQAVYLISKIPGREKEAWDKLIALYNSGNELDRTPTVEIELLYHFAAKRLYERYPDIKLPPELFRLLDPSAVLTPQEIRKRDWLTAKVLERVNPETKRREKPPEVSSPNLQKIR